MNQPDENLNRPTLEESAIITSIANVIAIYSANDHLNFFRSNTFKQNLQQKNLCFVNSALEANGIMNDGMLAALLYMILVLPMEFTDRNRRTYTPYSNKLKEINKKLLNGSFGAKTKNKTSPNANLLTLIRNAVSHTRLTLEDGHFIFKDRKTKGKKAPEVSIPSKNMGELIKELLHASQEIIDIINARAEPVSLN